MSADLVQPVVAAAAEPLDGTWLRHERERIAVGRRRLADQLHVAEARVAAVELKKLVVPHEWIRVLAELGFRIPEGVPVASVGVQRATESAEPAVAQEISQAPSSVPEAALTPAATGAPTSGAPPLLATAPPGIVAASSGQTNESAQAPSSEPPPRASQPGRPASPLTGAGLRKQRLQKSISQQALSEQLKVSAADLCRREKGDKPLPPRWLPILEKLGFSLPSAPPIAAPRPAPHGAKQMPQAAQHAVPMTPAALVDGRWLRAERERLGHSLNGMSKRLRVAWGTYARVERESLPIPRAWWSPLRKLDFRLPKPEPAASAQRAASAERRPELRGSWLVRERNRLGLSLSAVRKKLHIHPTTLTRVEREDLPVPAAWLPVLRKLKMKLEGAGPARVQTAPKAALPQSLAAPPAPAPTGEPPAPSQLRPDGRAELVEMILSYRLKYGRLTGQAPAEILTEIGRELSQAGAGRAISYEAVEQAMKALLQPLLSGRDT